MTSEINGASEEENNLFACCHISHARSGDETINENPAHLSHLTKLVHDIAPF